MNIQEIIAKKRDAKKLNKMEIEYFIKEYTLEKIPEYQAAALIMAICINGMDEEEIVNLTMAMAESGDKLDLSLISENVIDKHSTGGVGDKITIILMPIIASLGIPVAKMSGRGLGFTGGTVDKLESIPGYNTNILVDEFIDNVKKIGISLIGQTKNLAPADKKIYALRDSIACTKSIPLIASSIMSKKIAAGANKIVLDITVGKGAFMKNEQEALELANCMKKIGEMAKKTTICILTNMEQPLGYNIGNILEIKEAVHALKGDMTDDVKEIVETIGANMMLLANFGDNIDENKNEIRKVIKNGDAYRKFVQLVENQGGDISYIENLDKFETAEFVIPVFATDNGYIKSIDAEEIGNISVYLGAGRIKKDDKIDIQAGIVLNKKVGDKVLIGEPLAYIHTNMGSKVKMAIDKLEHAFNISKNDVGQEQAIINIIK